MKELRAILNRWQEIQDGSAALATVVSVEGSAYRRAGARMLIESDGNTIGSVSGGCLEADVIETGYQVMRDGKPSVLCFDTTGNRDLVFGTGLGCNGVIRILVEPLPAHPADSWLDALANFLPERATGILATVISAEDAMIPIGSRLLVAPHPWCSPCLTDTSLAQAVRNEAWQLLDTIEENRNGSMREIDGHKIFFESLIPSPSLLIVGSGNDAMPVARLAKELGWFITVIDDRATLATKQRFPQADEVRLCSLSRIAESYSLDRDCAAIVMTHNFARDVEALAALLPRRARYVGILGPKRRTQRILEYLSRQEPLREYLDGTNLHSPVGLDIGAETPEEIALSIIAEIQALRAGRLGGSLRDRPGGIHERPREKASAV